MTFQAAPQCVEATLNADQTGVPVVNRWNVDVGHAVTSADLSAVAGAIDAWITAYLAPSQVNQITYNSIVVKDISIANGEEITHLPTTPNGSVTSAPMANSTAAVISFRTASTGRSYRGRMYLGGLPQLALQDATHMKAAYAASYVVIGNQLSLALDGIGAKLVVLSRWLHLALRAVAIATEVITVIVDSKFDNQRRRTAN
jgi:hypothetical protein